MPWNCWLFLFALGCAHLTGVLLCSLFEDLEETSSVKVIDPARDGESAQADTHGLRCRYGGACPPSRRSVVTSVLLSVQIFIWFIQVEVQIFARCNWRGQLNRKNGEHELWAGLSGAGFKIVDFSA